MSPRITVSLGVLDAELVMRALDAYADANRRVRSSAYANEPGPVVVSVEDGDAIRVSNIFADSLATLLRIRAGTACELGAPGCGSRPGMYCPGHDQLRRTREAQQRARAVGLPEGLPNVR